MHGTTIHAHSNSPTAAVRHATRALIVAAGMLLATGCGEDNCPESGGGSVLAYAVQIGVTSQSGVLGALQFDVNYTGCSGGWEGSAGNVNCTFDVPVGLSVCNDKGRGRLSCALVDMDGFDTPTAIVTCVFKTSGSLDAFDYVVTVQDASGLEPGFDPGPDPGPAASSVTMAITDLVQL